MTLKRRVLLTVLAACAAAPVFAREKPAEPPPAALRQQLDQISRNPAQLADALRRGQTEASVCRHCHGAGGNSVLATVPNLASQNASYVLEQMNKFVAGTRTSSDFMTGMIKALTPAERVDIALFFAAQPVAAKPATSAAAGGSGKPLYDQLCASCHGARATGTQTIPRLAGQQPVYLEESLKRYRAGNGARIDPLMAAYTRSLKDADISALAVYLAGQR